MALAFWSFLNYIWDTDLSKLVNDFKAWIMHPNQFIGFKS